MTVPVRQAARVLKRSASQLWRMVQAGAPHAYRTIGGRRVLHVDPVKLEQWYARQHHLVSVQERPAKEHLDRLAVYFWDSLKRDSSGFGLPIHRVMEIAEPRAAGFLVLLHRYLFLRQFDRPPKDCELPDAIVTLNRIHASAATVASSTKGRSL